MMIAECLPAVLQRCRRACAPTSWENAGADLFYAQLEMKKSNSKGSSADLKGEFKE